MPPYVAGSRRPSTLRLTPFSTSTCTRRNLDDRVNLDDEAFELPPHLVRGPPLDGRAVVGEEDDDDRVARALLVAQERRPGALRVDADGLRAKVALDVGGVAARQAQRGEQPERYRLTVRQV